MELNLLQIFALRVLSIIMNKLKALLLDYFTDLFFSLPPSLSLSLSQRKLMMKKTNMKRRSQTLSK